MEKTILKDFTDRLLNQIGERIDTVKWFGSTARGERHRFFDIDVIVISDSEDRQLRNTVFDIAADISLEYDCLLSVIFISFLRYEEMKKAGRLLARNIEREGISLWKKAV
ncbi:MAG: nucleotidyltransferase domain-containing protein [bacterium]